MAWRTRECLKVFPRRFRSASKVSGSEVALGPDVGQKSRSFSRRGHQLCTDSTRVGNDVLHSDRRITCPTSDHGRLEKRSFLAVTREAHHPSHAEFLLPSGRKERVGLLLSSAEVTK